MSYKTEIFGAIKIEPQIPHEVAVRMSLWLNSRHWERPVPKTPQEIYDQTVFNKLDADHLFIMPSLAQARKETSETWNVDLAPHTMNVKEDRTEEQRMWLFAHSKEYSRTPLGIPSLYSDFMLIQGEHCSYLTWNGSEKSEKMDQWLKLIIDTLAVSGYCFYGKLLAEEQSGKKWTAFFQDNKLQFGDDTDWKNATFEDEAEDILLKSEAAAWKKTED